MQELKIKETETGYTVNEWEVALEPKVVWVHSLYLIVFYLQPIPKEKTKWTHWIHHLWLQNREEGWGWPNCLSIETKKRRKKESE